MHPDSSWIELPITIIVAMFASGGFWAYIGNRQNKKNSSTVLLTGLAHDNIVRVGKMYIARGWITYDEYEDFLNYLYEPYEKLGGNGLARRVADEVKNLRISNPKTEAYRALLEHYDDDGK